MGKDKSAAVTIIAADVLDVLRRCHDQGYKEAAIFEVNVNDPFAEDEPIQPPRVKCLAVIMKNAIFLESLR